MGKKRAAGEGGGGGAGGKEKGLAEFSAALRRQLADKKNVVRAFDIGGSGVKTGLLGAVALRDFLRPDGDGDGGAAAAAAELDGAAEPAGEEDVGGELQWIEQPASLGAAPGEDGFREWLLEALPRLRREVDDSNVCFGVSVGGEVIHASGILEDWWPGGGHPRELDHVHPKPLVADIMGLPPGRTFVLHDGEAHLLGCSRRAVPPPGLACLAIGTGVGIGVADGAGAVVDATTREGKPSVCLSGIPLSGAPYQGIWRQWLERPGGTSERVDDLMAKEFANMKKPWRFPWVSLVLGRRGMELAEAAHDCPEPSPDGGDDEARAPAVRAYGEQWLHFLHTQFVPQMCSPTRRHSVEQICFAGGVAERNWALLQEVMVEPGSNLLLSRSSELEATAAGSGPAGKKKQPKNGGGRGKSAPRVAVLPPAPSGSALIGAAIYALAGNGGGASGVWAQ